MANLHKPAYSDPSGYDENRNLQIMSINQQTAFYLVAGADLNVSTDDESIAVANAGSGDIAFPN